MNTPDGAGVIWPKYADLPVIPGTDLHHSWGVFGEADELGTLNWQTEERRESAARLVKTGQLFDLSLPLNEPAPQMAPARTDYEHVVARDSGGSDDYMNRFYLQGSSQWDSLQHVRFREFGYYGGRSEEDLDTGALGIDRIAAHGVAGRAVLIDVAGYAAEIGLDLRPDARSRITVADLDKVLEVQQSTIERGDVLVVRTGWIEWYRRLDPPLKAALAGSLHNGDDGLECPGLDPAPATAAWLWDHGVAAIAADNPAVETLRVRRSEGFLHRLLIPLLGMPLGEFWQLDELAAACRQAGRHHFFLASVPLRIPGGVGSPANAIAVL